MATGPTIPLTPLELLENDGTREPPIYLKVWAPVVCGSLGFLGAICGNWASKRPYFSGIQKHIFFAAVCAGLGKVADDYRNQYLADRDAVFKHYIQLHPEEFPPYERQKIGDLLLPWIPVR